MGKKFLFAFCLFVMASLVFGIGTVSAHTTIQVGEYNVEIGWLNEPPVAGQQNGIVVNVSSSGDPDPDENGTIDVSALKVAVLYGGQSRTLALRPLGENTFGQFVAPILPTRPGLYTVRLSGNLGDLKNISAEVQPEEVVPGSILQFPQAADPQTLTGGFGLIGWLAVIGMVSGLAGLLVAATALRKKPK